MLNDMLNYSTAMLSAVAQFLSSAPMIYILGFIALAVIVRVFSIIMGRS